MFPRYVIYAHRDRSDPSLVHLKADKGWWSKTSMTVARKTIAETWVRLQPGDERIALSAALRELAAVIETEGL